ncbi:MAG: DUF1194 domain-containing protein [Pseudomonadota bacterium]
MFGFRLLSPRSILACLALLVFAAAPWRLAQAQTNFMPRHEAPEPAPEGLPRIEVDVELVLAVDISRSMDIEELRIQRDGYVQAFRDPQVVRAIQGGLLGRIAVLYFEWAGPSIRNVIGDWTLIDGPEAAAVFADRLAAGRITAALGTSISGGLAFSAAQIEANRFDGLRRVIDVSGDGPNNSGPGVEIARDEVVALGMTINGLPLMMKARDGPFSLTDLDIYYEDCVIGGPQSFLLPLWDAAKFAETIRRKLILEISGLTPAPGENRRAQVMRAQLGYGPPREPRIDCYIGEKLRRDWVERRGWDW